MEPLDLPVTRASRSAPHICREVDSSSVRANLFRDFFSRTTESAASLAAGDEAIIIASYNIRNLSKHKDLSSLECVLGMGNEFDLVASHMGTA